MKENSKRNSGNSLSPLVAHNKVIGTVELLMMLLTSLEHLLLMSLLKIILKRLINLLLETLYTSVLFTAKSRAVSELICYCSFSARKVFLSFFPRG